MSTIHNSYRGKIDQSTIISLLSWYHLLTPPEQMSTSPIGCISPAHKWIIVNNCATIHATRHTHTQTTPVLSSHKSHSLPLRYCDATFFSQTITITNIRIFICFVCKLENMFRLSYTRRRNSVRSRSADECSTVCNVVGLFVSFRSAPRTTRAPPAPRTLRPL